MSWYEGKYKKLSSALFTFENSGKRSGEAPPWQDIYDSDLNMVDISGPHGADKIWQPIGYTENPPFPAEGYPAFALMFENKQTFTKTWWHYPKD